MNAGQFRDLLDAGRRRLLDGEPAAHAPQSDVVTLVPLLELVRELNTLLAPVQMRSELRTALHAALVAGAAGQLVGHPLLLPDSTGPITGYMPQGWVDRVNGWAEYAGQEWGEISEGDRRLVMGAAAALSVAGILAYVWQRRGHAA